MMILDRIALIVSIIGALNWGSIGLFQFDLVSWICGGGTTVAARIIYTVVALAGVWCISLLFRSREYDALHEYAEEKDTGSPPKLRRSRLPCHRSRAAVFSERPPRLLLVSEIP